MRRLLSVIFSIWAVTAFSQDLNSFEVSEDTTYTSDTIEDDVPGYKKLFIPRLYVDYGKVLTLWTDFESKTELGTELLLMEKLQLILEAGIWDLDPNDAFANLDYQVEGQYARVGVGYLGSIDDANKIGLGLRYGQSSFKDQGIITIESQSGLNQDFESSFSRDNLNARWMEITLNSERYIQFNKEIKDAAINRLFSWGILFRYRIMLDYTQFDEIDVYSIPGYGRSFDRSFPALNFFLKINFGAG